MLEFYNSQKYVELEFYNSQKYVELESNMHNCNRCYHQWYGKLKNPKTCANPKCRTPYWNKPRIRTQNKLKKPSNEKFYFYFESEKPNESYFFLIKNNEIICKECNHKTCKHVFQIISNSKIRGKIAKQGIELSHKYEDNLKELDKNIHAMTEFVQNQIVKE